MKTIIIFTLLATISFLTFSCEKNEMVKPSDMVTTQDKSFSNFDKLDIGTAFTVYVNFSETDESILIKANDNLHQYIIVEEISGVLKIKLQNNISISGNMTLEAHITSNNITEFKASEAVLIILNDKLVTADLNIELTEASNLSGEIEVTNLRANINEASVLKLSGTANSFNATVTEASNISDYVFSCNYLNINLDEASVAQLTVNQEIDVVAAKASSLLYKGSAVVTNQNISGASVVTHVN